MKIYSVLLAAGTGSRTGSSIPKQLIKIKSKEIILRSLEIFTKSSIDFNAIVIATPPPSVFEFDWNGFFNGHCGSAAVKLHFVGGGATRQDSVYNSVKYLESILPPEEMNDAVVFIHDSARPFVKDEELMALLEEACTHGAAFLCVPATETIKEMNDPNIRILSRPEAGSVAASETDQGRIGGGFAESMTEQVLPVKLRTLRRDGLISAKTPQVFRFSVIKKALEEAARTNFISTDDVSLLENLGLNAIPVKSTDFNIKITSPLDIEIAELFCDRFENK